MKQPMTIPKTQRRGLALIEILICASIASMMLTATAIAFRASMGAYRDNSDRDMLMSHGRLAMRQLVNEIRQADSHRPVNDVDVPNAQNVFKAGLTTEMAASRLPKLARCRRTQYCPGDDSTKVVLTWQYDPIKRCITRTRTVGGANATTTTVALYVQDFKVRMNPHAPPPTC